MDESRKGRKTQHKFWITYTSDGRESGGRTYAPAQAGQGAGKRNPPFKGRKRIPWGSRSFFRRQPSEVCKRQRMMFPAIKTEDGVIKWAPLFSARYRPTGQLMGYLTIPFASPDRIGIKGLASPFDGSARLSVYLLSSHIYVNRYFHCDFGMVKRCLS